MGGWCCEKDAFPYIIVSLSCFLRYREISDVWGDGGSMDFIQGRSQLDEWKLSIWLYSAWLP